MPGGYLRDRPPAHVSCGALLSTGGSEPGRQGLRPLAPSPTPPAPRRACLVILRVDRAASHCGGLSTPPSAGDHPLVPK